jgi:hypothetical protein
LHPGISTSPVTPTPWEIYTLPQPSLGKFSLPCELCTLSPASDKYRSVCNIDYIFLGYPIYAWKGETEEDFWWCIEKCINAPGWNPNMVNYQGNTNLIHRSIN